MVLPSQKLRSLIYGKNPIIFSENEINENQIQPASLDCRLGDVAYCVKATAIPKPGEKVSDLISRYASYSFSLKDRGVLEQGSQYIIPLREKIKLPKDFFAVFSPKSSIGRVGVFVRVLMDDIQRYDETKYGYEGGLYLEVVPLFFSVKVAPDISMVQMRIKNSNSIMTNTDLQIIHSDHGLVYDKNGNSSEAIIEGDSLHLNIDLSSEIIGFEARNNPSGIIDLTKENFHDADDFWIPIRGPKKEYILARNQFYLFSTKERIKIPADYSAEMAAYDLRFGEFRAHYAGFFDNGFGGERGTSGVLEIQVRDTPLGIFDGQQICRMIFEKTLETPQKIYGQKTGSHYIGSGPSLSKHFKKGQWR